jgi:lysyl endopeptidase
MAYMANRKHNRGMYTWKAWCGVVLVVAIGAAAGTVPVLAARTTHVAPEIKQGGLTVAELVAHQQETNRQISAIIPKGAANEQLEVGITQHDRELLAAPYVNDGTAPLKIGVVKPVGEIVGKPDSGEFTRGVIEESPGGGFVWAMEVSSPGAQAIRLHLTGFHLPDNTEMYLLGPNGQADGPYTGEGRNGNGDFWTRSISSDSAQLVLRYTGSTPKTDRPKMTFVVSDVGHIRGRPPQALEKNHDSWVCSDNASCLVDAQCVNNIAAVVDAKDAVAKMEWIKGPFIYTCTGGLLADTDTGSEIPYFLTANHCFSSSISNLETFFNYTTDSCNGTCPDSLVTGGTPPPASTVGITVVASGKSGDYTLGILDEDPPGNTLFLGWNNTPVASANGTHLYRISNPNFGPQVYSQHDVDTSSPTCRGLPRGQEIYSEDQIGATQGGSSGSPVINSAGEVVGQLTGCCGYDCSNVCDSANNWTIDGALAFYYASVEQFLDPGTTGGCTSDAECDDGLFCNGAETCVNGTCQSGSDPCGVGMICDEAAKTCSTLSCGINKASCSVNADCCSNNCKGGICRGN